MNMKQLFSTITIGFVLVAGLSGMAQATAKPKPRPKLFYRTFAKTPATHETHLHLDVACKPGYRPISCEVDVRRGDKSKHGFNKHFIAINENSFQDFDKHRDEHFKGKKLEGCHFRANNMMPLFKNYVPFSWKLVGSATCVPKHLVGDHDAHEYYAEEDYYEWYPEYY